MNTELQQLVNLSEIRKIMDRSSRFISLSGWSGVAAGICGLAGSAAAYYQLGKMQYISNSLGTKTNRDVYFQDIINHPLFYIAIITFIMAFSFAFLFTYLRSKKDEFPVWGTVAKRLIISVFIPMFAGAVFIFKLIESGNFEFISGACLIFYGLALLNASRLTLTEIAYLAYCEIALGIINLWFFNYSVFLWASGFGALHIIYGLIMWMKYERK